MPTMKLNAIAMNKHEWRRKICMEQMEKNKNNLRLYIIVVTVAIITLLLLPKLLQ